MLYGDVVCIWRPNANANVLARASDVEDKSLTMKMIYYWKGEELWKYNLFYFHCYALQWLKYAEEQFRKVKNEIL